MEALVRSSLRAPRNSWTSRSWKGDESDGLWAYSPGHSRKKKANQANHVCKALVLRIVGERLGNGEDPMNDLHWHRLDPIRGRVLFRITT